MDEYRYSFVEKFYPTEFAKTSKGAMRVSRNFNLKDILGVEALPR
ncbi:hypothetical protein [Phascolarctobacterium sp.]|nr:hypothetical protein [Phascolarctobacterium sp.]